MVRGYIRYEYTKFLGFVWKIQAFAVGFYFAQHLVPIKINPQNFFVHNHYSTTGMRKRLVVARLFIFSGNWM